MTTELETPGPGPASGRDPERPHRRSPAWWRGMREILLIFGLWLFYSAGRNLADKDFAGAQKRATDILDLEKVLHLDFEHWLNHGATSIVWLSVLMCFWYAALHYAVTPVVLVYIYVRHRDDYHRVRNALVLACVVALIYYIFFPTAPPRMFPELGFQDTMAVRQSYGWWTAHASAPAGMQQLTNELAAMPSLHVGWTVWVAWALRKRVGRVGRALSVFYVVGTTMVVLCTANHWTLDIVAGIALVLAAIFVVNHAEPLRRDDGVVTMFVTLGRRLRGSGPERTASRE